MNPKTISRLKQGGLVVAPFALVLAIGFFTGESAVPDSASADPGSAVAPGTTIAEGALSQAPTVKPSAKQLAAAMFVLAYKPGGLANSPMLQLPATAVEEPRAQPSVTASQSVSPGGPKLRITAMMGSGPTAIAVVNGRAVRVGDKLANGYVIANIDVSGGSISLRTEGASGESAQGLDRGEVVTIHWDRSASNTRIEITKPRQEPRLEPRQDPSQEPADEPSSNGK